MIEGVIVRKKKRSEFVVVTLRLLPPDPPKKILLHRTDSSSAIEFCFIGSTIRVYGEEKRIDTIDRDEDDTDDGIETIVPLCVQLIRCASDPNAVEWAMQAVVKGDISPGVFRSPDGATDLLSLGDIHELLSSSSSQRGRSRTKRLAVAKIVRQLSGEAAERPGRKRPPHVKRADRILLERLESTMVTDDREAAHSNLRLYKAQRRYLGDGDEGNDATDEPLSLNHPQHSDKLVSCRGNRLRSEYLHGKKEPQVRWMKERIRMLKPGVNHILDVGGGRGDLATALAAAFPNSLVTLVEKNKPSLLAGQEHASKQGCAEHMHFIHADFSHFASDPSVYLGENVAAIDLVVALHACGDLSDMALDFARRRGCPFLVCPCCFTKHLIPSLMPSWYSLLPNSDDLEALQRLAESENRELSTRAMMIINSLRLHSLGTSSTVPYQCLVIEEFEKSCSLRNFVLVGTPPG